MKKKTIEEYMSLNAMGRFVAFILAYLPISVDGEILLRLLTAARFTTTLRTVHLLIDELLKRGFAVHIGKHHEQLANAAQYSLPAYIALMDDARANDWFFDADKLEKAVYGSENATFALLPDLAANECEGIDHKNGTRTILATAELAYALATGSSALVSQETQGFIKSRECRRTVGRGAAHKAATTSPEEPVYVISDASDPLVRVMGYSLNIRFIYGLRVANALEALSGLSSYSNEDAALIYNHEALCVWTARRDGVLPSTALPREVSLELGELRAACRNVFDGNVKKAVSLFRRFIEFSRTLGDDDYDGYYYSRPDDRHVDCDDIPARLLAAMAVGVANPAKIVKKTPADIMWLYPAVEVDGASNEKYESVAYLSDMKNVCDMIEQYWTDAASGRLALPTAQKFVKTSAVTPLLSLVPACSYRCMTGARAKFSRVLDDVLARAHALLDEGYPTLAGLLVAFASPGLNDDVMKEPYIEDVLSRAVALLPVAAASSDWDQIINALEAVVGKTEKLQRRRENSVQRGGWIWRVRVCEHADGRFAIDRLSGLSYTLGLDGKRLYGTETSDGYEISKQKNMRLMSEKDRLIAGTLGKSYYNYTLGKEDTQKLLPALCGMDNIEILEATTNDYYNREYGNPVPAKLELVKCEMRTAYGGDGGLSISVPQWAFSADEGFHLVRRGESGYQICEVTMEARRIIEALRTFGHNGKIVFPAAVAKKAVPLVESISRILPVAEPTEAEKQSLERIPATPEICIRLAFADGRLAIRAVSKPLAANPACILEPGVGQSERLVDAGMAVPCILVRDLAAEKANLDKIKTALADCESWFDGRNSWTLDNLSVALSALSTLKGLAENDAASFVLEWLDDKRLSVTSAPKSGITMSSRRTADDWFRVDGSFTLDDGRVLSIAKMLEASGRREGNFVRLSDGDYVRLSAAMARELDALGAASRRKGDGVEVSKAAIPMLDKAFVEAEDALALPDAMAATAEEIRAAFAKKPTLPRTLNAELRPYQQDGYRWLSRLAACGFGSCLADDMGLGKTLQAIALLLERSKNGASLVIAPSSVCGNWKTEIARFAPTLRVVMAMEHPDGLADETEHGNGVIAISSYGYLLFHEDEFSAIQWNGIILDEAQAIKNDASKRAKAVKRLHSRFRMVATGTPVENRLGELWSIFDFLNPGLLGPAASFTSRFTVDGRASPELKRLVNPLILRRLKGDVLDDLPEKTEITLGVELGNAERTAYEGCRVHALASLERKSSESEDGASRIAILAELTRLRRFCCHPSLVLPGESIPSAKMEALLDLLANLREGGHRALVFSQFTDYLAIVRKALDARSWPHLYLDGSTPTLERGRLVDAFQAGEGDFFLISLKAGGTGLNLTAANYVILLDPWWNPAVENQAADRAHRIGQKNPVTVYRLIAKDTVEERVLELHREKKEIAEDVLDGTSSASLSQAQLMRLFA